MHKSQLRLLARKFADGSLDQEAYRLQRSALVDAIVSGELSIERQGPPTEATPAEATPGAAPREPAPPPAVPAPRKSPHVPIYGGIGLVVTAALIWLLWPAEDPPQQATNAAPAVPVKQVSAARNLVEDFLAAQDWSEAGIARFNEEWSALSDAQRAGARGSHWFARLVKSIGQEIKTQKALAGIDDTGTAVETGQRLVEFGATLGISKLLPAFEVSGADREQAAGDTTQATIAPAPESTAGGGQGNGGRESSPEVAGDTTTSGARWLQAQPAHNSTLQLFALNHLDKVEQIIAGQPGLGLKVFETRTPPRYRVVYGSFDSAASARAAHGSLPEAVTGGRPTPLVKSLGSLQRELGSDMSAGSAEGPKTNARFTLQLFASNNRANVDRLIEKYPELDLEVFETPDSSSRYRLLYGSFDSSSEAEAASSTLPESIVEAAGDPLIKSMGELRSQ